MDACISSYQSYGKMSKAEEREYRRRKQRRLIIIGVSSFLLLVIVIGAVVGAVVNDSRNKRDESNRVTPPASSIKAVCSVTLYPDSCYSSIISAAQKGDPLDDPKELIKLSLQVAIEALSNIASLPDTLSTMTNNHNKAVQGALSVCEEMFSDAMDRLNDSIELLTSSSSSPTSSKISSLRSWLSAAITNQVTCLDELEDSSPVNIKELMAKAMVNSTQFTSNSLAIVTKVGSTLSELDLTFNRKLLATTSNDVPIWVSASRRGLIERTGRLRPDVTVAKDGSGQYETINDALKAVPKKNKKLFSIYVKEGVYREIVKVDKDKWNVLMFGDGMYKTIVAGSLNKIDGVNTSLTATFTVVGKNFTAKDMGFNNNAGPKKQQAVALRSASDFSLFHRCSFVGFQDTLYAHSLRQFYRDCEIVGTVDFIFGDASVIFQNCSIRPRQPLPNQKNTITAQGRSDPNENTGISIQGCTISPFDNVTVQTYLGRPWKNCSVTVIMDTNIGEMVDPEGWLEWYDGVVPPDTIFYAEYQNHGAGASVADRVNWPGYKPTLSKSEAESFAAESFIQASDWLPAAGVDFSETV